MNYYWFAILDNIKYGLTFLTALFFILGCVIAAFYSNCINNERKSSIIFCLMNIIEILQQLKDLTLDIIKEVNNDNDVNEMLKRREQLVSDLIACEVDKEEKKSLYLKLGIDKDEKNLLFILEEKSKSLKEEIRNSKQRRAAFSSYSSNGQLGNLFARRV